MSGITDWAFRHAAMRFGASWVVSEMVASDAYVRRDAETTLRAEGAGIAPHVVQIAGCDPTSMGEAARLAEASGASIVDINMGCPAKRVTGGYAGSALMRDLDHALRLIDATVAAVSVPVTVKMRLGWDDASRNAPELARRAEQAGVALVSVHGRTRCQFYTGRADWAAIRSVVDAVRIPVVANGDGGSLADARDMLAASGAAAVMIGRAALGRPWIVGQIAAGLSTGSLGAPPAPDERRDTILHHLDALQTRLGAIPGLRHARKHLAAYADHAAADGFGLPATDRRALVTTEDGTTVRRLVARLFDPASAFRHAA